MTALVVYLQNTIARLRERQEGQTMAEYALILGGIAVVVIAGILILGPAITNLFKSTGSSVQTLPELVVHALRSAADGRAPLRPPPPQLRPGGRRRPCAPLSSPEGDLHPCSRRHHAHHAPPGAPRRPTEAGPAASPAPGRPHTRTGDGGDRPTGFH